MSAQTARTEHPWLDIALTQVGQKEVRGKAANAAIIEKFAKVGHDEIDSDEVAWCAVQVGACLVDAGYSIPPREVNMMARSYLNYGLKLDAPKPGCICVMPRGKPPFGHVGIVKDVDIDAGTMTLVEGNLSNQVKVVERKISEALPNGFRWPVKAGDKPPVVKPVLPTVAASKSVWAQLNAMALVALGYLTDLLQQGWELAAWAVSAIPVIVSGASPSIDSGRQVAEWLNIPWSKVGFGAALACMGVALVRHIQDRRRTPW